MEICRRDDGEQEEERRDMRKGEMYFFRDSLTAVLNVGKEVICTQFCI